MPDHLGVDKLRSSVAVITGDPERVEYLAASFDERTLLTAKRGFVCYEVVYSGIAINLVATGIGSPSTAIVAEELIDLGVSTIIRLGTCGSLQEYVTVGSVVVSTGSVRAEGTSVQYVDLGYPAIPDLLLTCGLLENIKKTVSENVYYGITHCKDAYYGEKILKSIDQVVAAEKWLVWRKANVLATEMEAAALFVVGSIRGIRTAAVLVSVGSCTTAEDTGATFRQIMKAIFLLIQNNAIVNSEPPKLSSDQHSPSFLGSI